MTQIEDFLNEFDDYEIAVFCKYKLTEYMSGTQNEIKEYIKRTRGLDESKLDKVIIEKPAVDKNDKSICCPVCHSKKLLKTRVKWNIPVARFGYEDEMASWKEITTGEATYKDKIECYVCGHVLYDPNNEKRPFYMRLLDIFFDQPLPF